MMWGSGWSGWVAGFLMMVVFWGGLVLLVVLALRGWNGSRVGEGDRRERPLEILAKRFARGEISADEFEERSRVLDPPLAEPAQII